MVEKLGGKLSLAGHKWVLVFITQEQLFQEQLLKSLVTML